MALRDWSARRLGAAWIIGLIAQLALLGGVALYNHLTEPPEFRAARLRLDSLVREGRAQDDSIARGLRPPPPDTPARISGLPFEGCSFSRPQRCCPSLSACWR